jgi:hypothetical protein
LSLAEVAQEMLVDVLEFSVLVEVAEASSVSMLAVLAQTRSTLALVVTVSQEKAKNLYPAPHRTGTSAQPLLAPMLRTLSWCQGRTLRRARKHGQYV